jgi:hypothetical protein
MPIDFYPIESRMYIGIDDTLLIFYQYNKVPFSGSPIS